MDRMGSVVEELNEWPVQERVVALKRVLSHKKINEVVRDGWLCPRLPGGFGVWLVVAMGLFCRDCYRQVFRWLQPAGFRSPARWKFSAAACRPLSHASTMKWSTKVETNQNVTR